MKPSRREVEEAMAEATPQPRQYPMADYVSILRAEILRLRKDKERLDWLFWKTEGISVVGANGWVSNRRNLDAAMKADKGRKR